jgi:NAD(P)-dependent dehydrogenase (short-subunit alcohol dehydrogenase family)
VPTFRIYCSSKWAGEGFTEAVSQEVQPDWGIKFTCIEPGGFRTDGSGQSMHFAQRYPAYHHIDAEANMNKRHGMQAGDARKGARAMYEFAVM